MSTAKWKAAYYYYYYFSTPSSKVHYCQNTTTITSPSNSYSCQCERTVSVTPVVVRSGWLVVVRSDAACFTCRCLCSKHTTSPASVSHRLISVGDEFVQVRLALQCRVWTCAVWCRCVWCGGSGLWAGATSALLTSLQQPTMRN